MANELISDHVSEAIERYEKMYPWMDSDEIKTYFEMTASLGTDMDAVQCVCSKTYARGLIFITVYFEDTFYVTISEGMGDQPLLDVRFPDVSKHGEGVTLMSYVDDDIEARYKSLILWQSLAGEMKLSALLAPRVKKTKNLASDSYVQSYVVLKGEGGNDTFRTAMFRFGSWCYSGRVQLTAALSLSDLPHVIPALRMQQVRSDKERKTRVGARSEATKRYEYCTFSARRFARRKHRSNDINTALFAHRCRFLVAVPA